MNNTTKKNKKYKHNFFYDIFWKILLNNEIEMVFGIPGSPIDALLSKKPKQILWKNVGNELQNGFVSQIYGEYTNNVGYLFVTSGPGISTAISALEQAIYEEKPLIVVSDVDSTANFGDFQSWDIKNISKSLTDNFFYIKNKKDVFSVMKKSYEKAKHFNTGVILLFEKNIFIERMYKIPKINMKPINMNKLKLANDLKNYNFKNVLLVIGRLNVNDYPYLIEFIKVNNLPFVTTWKGRFSIKNYILNCGRIGTLGKHSGNYALYNATHLLVIGSVSGLLKNSTKNKFSVMFTENKHIISLSYNKKFSLESNIVYEINALSNILENLKLMPKNDWINKLIKSNSILNVDLPRISKLEKFTYMTSLVYKNNNLTIPVSIDVGNNWYAMGKYIDTEKPNCFESATTWASIGIAISNGIAIHYATNKEVWVFIGDGGTWFSSNDLLYLLNNQHLPITVTIYVNHIYAAITEDFTIKNYKRSEVSKVPNIPILNILPNCHIFYDEKKYHHYLNNNIKNDKVRFIIIMIPDTDIDNYVYEINADSEYEENLKNDMFDNILNTKMIL